MNLTQGDIKSQLIKIAFPAGIGMMFHTFYNITDTFYAGLIGSEAIGAMEKCYKLTIEYTQQREQFGQSLSKFQALQHRMVDMFMETEFSKSFLLKVLATDDASERRKLVYGLKHQIAKAGKYVGEEAVQLHGGMGVTEEMSIGH